MLNVKRETPGGTQYFVRNDYTQSNGTLNHSCHVVLLGRNDSLKVPENFPVNSREFPTFPIR